MYGTYPKPTGISDAELNGMLPYGLESISRNDEPKKRYRLGAGNYLTAWEDKNIGTELVFTFCCTYTYAHNAI